MKAVFVNYTLLFFPPEKRSKLAATCRYGEVFNNQKELTKISVGGCSQNT